MIVANLTRETRTERKIATIDTTYRTRIKITTDDTAYPSTDDTYCEYVFFAIFNEYLIYSFIFLISSIISTSNNEIGRLTQYQGRI